MTEDPEHLPVSPEQEPYTSEERYQTLKEDHKALLFTLSQTLADSEPKRVADLGCANGELLYAIKQRFPDWELYGYDVVPEFISTARNFEGLEDVHFECLNFFELEDQFDVVLSTSVLPAYQDPKEPLKKMLSLCREGGIIQATGLFNPFDVEVRVEFLDRTHESSRETWQTDFNRHSRDALREWFAGRVESVSFERCPFNVSIQHDPDNPIRVWTITEEDGTKRLINGAGQLLNHSLMTVVK